MTSEFREVRYEPDDRVPWPLALGLGLQLVSLCINGVVLLPAVVFRAAGAEEHLLWAVFASVIACGFSAILQAARIGRIGAGYVLAHGSSVLFIAVCVTALDQGGPALLATLVVLSAVFQVGLSGRLSLLHRILTPVVMGTVIMLLPVTVVPILLDMISQSPPDAPPVAGPLSAGVTVSVIVGIALTGTATLRLWAPVIGIVAGALVGSAFGIYDVGLVADAAWVGIPSGRLPGFDLDFGPAFWGLLPAFLFAALIGLTQSVAMAIAVQRLAWRRPRAVDYRAVQRTVAAEGVGNVLAGIAGTIPSTPSAPSVAASEVTGVAARGVGIAAGITFLALALLPKALAVILAIPVGVVAGAILVILVMFFMVGMREVVLNAPNVRTGLISGIAFWTGIAFEFDMVFPEYFASFAGGLLSNGMTTGGLVALLLTAATMPRADRFRCDLDVAALPGIREFVRAFAVRRGLEGTRDRLEAAAEETLLALLESRPQGEEGDPGWEAPDGARRELVLTARKENDEAVLEFRVGAADSDQLNLQDRVAWVGEETDVPPLEQDLSLRLLRHFASSVRHQQFQNMEVVTLRFSAAGPKG